MPFIEMPQRDAGIALDDQQPAAPGGAGILAGVTFDDDGAGHHVFRNARPGRSLDVMVACLFMPAQ
jgi:hypothetical protein